MLLSQPDLVQYTSIPQAALSYKVWYPLQKMRAISKDYSLNVRHRGYATASGARMEAQTEEGGGELTLRHSLPSTKAIDPSEEPI